MRSLFYSIIKKVPIHYSSSAQPGRVVTLVPGNQEDKVWGVAFEIPEDHVEQVTNQLNHRERRYTAEEVSFYPEDNAEPEINLRLYIATDNNSNYLGPADLGDIAQQICQAEGPSGTNIDYVLNLAQSLRTLLPHVEDPYLFELEKLVLDIQQNKGNLPL